MKKEERKKEREKGNEKQRDAMPLFAALYRFFRGRKSDDRYYRQMSETKAHAHIHARRRRRRRGSIRNAALFDPWIVYCAIPPDQG